MDPRRPSPLPGAPGRTQARAVLDPIRRASLTAALVLLPLAVAGCAAGGDRFTEADPAGFWAGLWHGLILAFTFVISLFTDSVRVYEFANSGALYDLGFVLGVCIFFGGSCKAKKPKSKARREKEREWAEISETLEERIRTGIKRWLEESGQEDKEWQELGEKIEEKIKRELRRWAEK